MTRRETSFPKKNQRRQAVTRLTPIAPCGTPTARVNSYPLRL